MLTAGEDCADGVKDGGLVDDMHNGKALSTEDCRWRR